VANPSRTKELCFVADGSGAHAFAESYDKPQRNVARWRQIEKTRAATDGDSVDRIEPDVEAAAGELTQELRGAADGARPAGSGRGRGFDASEGTEKDPLKNKTFDLTNPKSVPSLRQP